MNTFSSNASDISEDKYRVPALERGLRLLCEFKQDNRSLSPPELARRLDLPRSTVFRLLNTLEGMGFVERVEKSNDYRLGLAVLRLGFEYLASLELTQLGQPILEQLCAQTQHPCNLVVRDERSVVYVAKVLPDKPLTSSVRVGTRLPAHATVFGRILLSELSFEKLQQLYAQMPLDEFSTRTPKSIKTLFDLCQADRERGYVCGEGFFESSISTVAAPVRDHQGHVVAALGVTVMAAHIEEQQRPLLIEKVTSSARQLSSLLNHQPQ